MKKIIITALAALMALSVFTGCQLTSDDTAKNAEGEKNAKVVFTKDNVKTNYGTVKYTDDGFAYMNAAGNYASLIIDLKDAPVNLKDSTVSIKLRATENFFNSQDFGGDADSGAKFQFYTNDGLGSESPVPQTTVAKGVDGDAITLKIDVSDDLPVVWTSDNSISKAYFPYITAIKMNVQKCQGEIYIESISVKNN